MGVRGGRGPERSIGRGKSLFRKSESVTPIGDGVEIYRSNVQYLADEIGRHEDNVRLNARELMYLRRSGLPTGKVESLINRSVSAIESREAHLDQELGIEKDLDANLSISLGSEPVRLTQEVVNLLEIKRKYYQDPGMKGVVRVDGELMGFSTPITEVVSPRQSEGVGDLVESLNSSIEEQRNRVIGSVGDEDMSEESKKNLSGMLADAIMRKVMFKINMER